MIWILLGFACLLVISTFVLFSRRGGERTDAPRNSADRAERKELLVQEAQRMFSMAGWKVAKSGNRAFDFISSKSMITVSVFCFDKSDLYYVSRSNLLERFESESRVFYSNHYKVLIYYTNIELGQFFLDTAARQGLVLFTASDINLLLSAYRYENQLPGKLDARVEAIFQRHQNISLLLSRRFYDAGEQDTAVVWAHHAVEARHLSSVRFSQIFNHLKLINDLDGAKRFGTDFCALHRNDTEAIGAMANLHLHLGEYNQALGWGIRFSNERPDDSAGYVSQAAAHEGLGSSREALSRITKAAAVAPSSQIVLEAAVRIARTAAAPELESQWLTQLAELKGRALVD